LTVRADIFEAGCAGESTATVRARPRVRRTR